MFHIQIRVLTGGPFYVEKLSREEGSLGLPELPWARQLQLNMTNRLPEKQNVARLKG